MLLPDETLARQAIVSSQALRRSDSIFTLEDGKFYPHLSLYMVRLKPSDIAQAADRLSQIIATQKPFVLHATHYDQERSYVVIDYQTSPELDALQQTVLDAINPFETALWIKTRNVCSKLPA